MTHIFRLKNIPLLFLVASLFLITGCDVVPMHMRNQPRYDTFEESPLFADGLASRKPPENTIPRGEWGELMMDEALFTGMENGEFVETIPIEVDREVLLRGRERFDIFCSPCHGRVGDGQGMIVQRGFQQPQSFHFEAVREQPDGYFYDVMTNGFGAMYSYASRINPEDRWAIVAYIRALQFSQNVPLDSLPDDMRQEIEAELGGESRE